MEKRVIEPRKTTVSAEISLGWESDVQFCQHGRSFGRNFSSEIKGMFEKFMQYI